MHCQSPFLPGANTSDIGAKAKEEAENGLSAAGSPDHRRDPERRCVQRLLLKLGKTKIDAEQRQHRDLADSFYRTVNIDVLNKHFLITIYSVVYTLLLPAQSGIMVHKRANSGNLGDVVLNSSVIVFSLF